MLRFLYALCAPHSVSSVFILFLYLLYVLYFFYLRLIDRNDHDLDH